MKAADGLGKEYGRCVVFEDAPAGIAAARAAGMMAVGVLTTYPASALTGATELIQDFLGVTANVVLGHARGIEIQIEPLSHADKM